ncbi:MAG: hypothetical protein ACTSUV_01935 [Candidatus Ranarchaeia archaeon]
MLEDRFQFDNFKFFIENQKVKIEILEGTPELIIKQKTISPLEKNTVHSFNYWICKQLVDMKKAKFVELEESVEEIYNILWNEQNDKKIQDLPELFFTKMNTYLEELHKKNLGSPDPISVETEEKLRSTLRDIIEIRLSKILKLVRLEDTRDSENILSEEEKWLFRNLTRSIKEWKEQLLNIENERRD